MTGGALDSVLDGLARFDGALASVDVDAAIDVVEDLVAGGVDPITVLVDVIASAQRTVGERWQRGEWSVAEEHAATAVSVSATEAVARWVRRTPATRGRVVVACAEREWHALPAMIVGTALRAEGWDITLLGASTPPARLSQYLHDLGPDATAVSCSVLGALPTTRRFIEASTDAGIPVVVGGSAFGGDDRRAVALGATAWASGAREAVAAVRSLPTVVAAATPLSSPAAAEQSTLELNHRRLVTGLREGWSLAAQIVTTETLPLDSLHAVAADVVNQAFHAVSAALLTGDPRTISGTAAWVADLLAARAVDPSLVGELGRLLTKDLRDYPIARSLVQHHWTDPITTGPR
ncbi:cobalamin B12-binding domain-containing protein [Actinokineospora cianjurensis]|uniref:Methanogenic corrinoid protein MtbC1 n=1 Tax=Actinokineospora cianjurensis TaxID=585224 RepID=A0A421BCV8_9PSEU|nr:cobalamin-dependent protein [Actinokineospora cianjurensis]RLK62171.1 methanogenic corrinoid protein MtbC1 [Actinokineospora cianjurensis]